ncbi:S2-RNase [Pyrus ussuriensis x Pyrus communis]|uniref:S2-RNase n=1 Tax=Pyrus ussuriensis x Pyrus communis TaxID=2448454 RepID=A0A5N5HIZ8_9ROSA|nr:S2-RNase [Pyrus ussuriensis x Pyrus communis]
MKEMTKNPVTKKNLALLGRKWYIIRTDGKPVKEMGASMIRRVQRQHKAHMNSLKVPTTLETSENVKIDKRTNKEVEKANSKTEGQGDHAPLSLHPGKYRILKRSQEDMVMMPTAKWSPEPICFGTISPEKRIPSPLLVDTLCESPVTSTYRALLGRDWIHQSLYVPSTLHQRMAVYHEEGETGPGFWEMVEAESRPFLPTTNIAEANFYDPSIGIIYGGDCDWRKEMTRLEERTTLELVKFLCVEPNKPPPEVQDPLETIDLGTKGDPRPIQISGLLEVEVRAKIVSFLHEFKDCFAWHYTEIPALDSTLVKHIMLIKEGYKPVKQAPRRMSKEIEEKVKEEIERLVKAGFIRPAKYVEWLANIVPILKAITNAVRYCVNYKNINGATPKDEYPMPMADLSIDVVAKHKVLSFMDGNAGHNQIKMAKKDIRKITFRCACHVGADEYLVMSFGLKNAGATYQRAMNAIFHDLIGYSMESSFQYVPQKTIKGQVIADFLAEHQEFQDEIINIQELWKTSKMTTTGTTPYALTFRQDVVLLMEINGPFIINHVLDKGGYYFADVEGSLQRHPINAKFLKKYHPTF